MSQAADYRHRVRFERLANKLDSNGQPLQDDTFGALDREWTPIATVWASIKPLSARDYIAAGGPQSEFTARIEIRYRTDLSDSAGMRAIHVVNGVDAVIYELAGPLPDDKSLLEHLTFAAKAGASGTGE